MYPVYGTIKSIISTYRSNGEKCMQYARNDSHIYCFPSGVWFYHASSLLLTWLFAVFGELRGFCVKRFVLLPAIDEAMGGE